MWASALATPASYCCRKDPVCPLPGCPPPRWQQAAHLALLVPHQHALRCIVPTDAAKLSRVLHTTTDISSPAKQA